MVFTDFSFKTTPLSTVPFMLDKSQQGAYPAWGEDKRVCFFRRVKVLGFAF